MAKESEDATIASWYELGFSRGLTEPSLIMGVPKEALTYNGLVAVFFLMNFHFWQILPVSLVVHFGMVYVCKGDMRFFECLKSYINKKNYYGT